MQADYFSREIADLRTRGTVRKGSKLASVTPFIDERGVMRTKGRILRVSNATFENNVIIIDGRHPATRLLVKEYHRRFCHAGPELAMNEVRQRFYILGLRRVARSVAHKCLGCRLRRARPQNPIMAPLPKGRLAYRERPFTHCGVDYFGPMLINIGRRREKRWGVIFTCLTTRAIHFGARAVADSKFGDYGPAAPGGTTRAPVVLIQ